MPRLETWAIGIPPAVCGLISQIAAEHRTSPEEILSGFRGRNTAAARWEIIRALRLKNGNSVTVIGQWMGLHHTSVSHCLRRHGIAPYATTIPPDSGFDPAAPDESGVWAI